MTEEQRKKELQELVRNSPNEVVELLLNWELEISKVMPLDFKDWWQNCRKEWPLVARLVIESAREQEDLAWKMVNNREY